MNATVRKALEKALSAARQEAAEARADIRRLTSQTEERQVLLDAAEEAERDLLIALRGQPEPNGPAEP